MPCTSSGFDGSEPVYLFGEHSFNHSPEYSPDGSKLMFNSDRGGSSQIDVVDADAAATTPFEGWQALTDPEFAAEGSCSPDGTRVAFCGIADGNRDTFVMDADGGNLMRLTEHPGRDDAPDWSPDSTQIAYMSEASGTNTDIFVMDAARAVCLLPELVDGWRVDRLRPPAVAKHRRKWHRHLRHARGRQRRDQRYRRAATGSQPVPGLGSVTRPPHERDR